MSVSFSLHELLDYSDYERNRWKAWIAADPGRLRITFQPGGRFPTIAALLDHVFLIERRHLCRLEGGVPPDATGVAPDDWEGLFEYAELVRADFREYVEEMDEAIGRQTLAFQAGTEPVVTSRRKLVLHVILHEMRHLAQLAYAARLAGHPPPGGHDYLFFPEPDRPQGG